MSSGRRDNSSFGSQLSGRAETGAHVGASDETAPASPAVASRAEASHCASCAPVWRCPFTKKLWGSSTPLVRADDI
ncbi:hypothetical protein BTN45_21535 [Rhizobium sp. ZX09]|nr:hypothetical protein BTN45_21535 [Rhizobium sp. ZX09]